MKSIYLTLALGLIATAQMLAQPVINNSTLPPMGASIEFFHANYDTPSAAGPNQTWSWNPQVNAANTKRVEEPSTAPAGSLIDGADVALTQQQSSLVLFYAANNQRIGFAGVRYSQNFRINYNGSMMMWPLPIAYNDTYSEAFTSTYTRNGETYHRKGMVTGKADAWGELTTMWRTYENVLRVQVETVMMDSSFQDTVTVYDTISLMAHYYLANDIPLYLFSQITGRDHRGNSVNEMVFQNPFTADVALPTEDQGYRVFPNPATDHIMVQQELKGRAPSPYTLLNIAGQTVLSGMLAEDNERIGVEHLPNGLYVLRIEGSEGQVALPFVKQ